jgi:hypothetical protein
MLAWISSSLAAGGPTELRPFRPAGVLRVGDLKSGNRNGAQAYQSGMKFHHSRHNNARRVMGDRLRTQLPSLQADARPLRPAGIAGSGANSCQTARPDATISSVRIHAVRSGRWFGVFVPDGVVPVFPTANPHATIFPNGRSAQMIAVTLPGKYGSASVPINILLACLAQCPRNCHGCFSSCET